MDLIQGWFLRSVRRDSVTENPVLAIERLSSLPRPLDDEGKEMLVGAMLTMSSSLHLALGMLREVLPQDKSQDRLAEVLCPTLGHLLASVQSTISSFNPKGCQQQVIEALPPPSAQPTTTQQTPPRSPRDIPKPQSLEQSRPPSTPRDGQKTLGRLPVGDATTSPPASTTQPRQFDTFPPLEHRGAATQSRSEVDVPQRPEARLVKALQAEMRVQAAIHVAVESLEFAEGQLQIVREVNQLHGGDFGLLQKHFYEGYHRLMYRALELQRRELGLQQPASDRSATDLVSQRLAHPDKTEAQQCIGQAVTQVSPKQQPSVSFRSTSPAHSRATTPRAANVGQTPSSGRPQMGRRNTIQGIKEEDPRIPRTRPALKRRLSLAEELAMAGEDSESGYHDETSEVASSASELEESDVESCNDSPGMMSRGAESEGYSTNGESADEESAIESGDDEDSGDKTLEALDVVRHVQPAVSGSGHSQSRLPRLQTQRRG